ncbi:DUF421 domain-containing protein [Reyranella sp.]|uniref:DUF421 domain-containing protein n=1 Tax=Reyranella sp. TaxID=1929291 RepID=UPI003D129E79
MSLGQFLAPVDWADVFLPTQSVLELFVRASAMYFILFVLLRLVLRRHTGGLGTSDLLVVVLVAEIAGNGINGESFSVVGGAISVATVLLWTYGIEWLQYHVPGLERLVREPKLKLIDGGKLLRRNMRAELITFEELMTQLREQGVQDCAEVKAAYVEADGKISILRYENRG